MTEEPKTGTVVSDEDVQLAVMQRKIIRIAIVCACVFFAALFIVAPIIGSYNALVDSDIQVTRAAANIKTDLERRADLLPNLAESVKGSAKFEYSTLTDIAYARSLRERLASSGSTDIATLSATDAQLTTLYGNFVKLQEMYPDLQTTQQFREFGAQVTATENQILVDRQTYNAAVMQYQSVCRSFPTTLIAGMFGYQPDKYRMYTPANETYASTVPTISFDDMKL